MHHLFTALTLTLGTLALEVSRIIDCGSTWNLISHQWVKASGFIPWDYDPPQRLYTVNGDSIRVYGGYKINVDALDIKGRLRTVSSWFCAVDIAGSVDLILSLPWLVDAQPLVDWAEGHFAWQIDGVRYGELFRTTTCYSQAQSPFGKSPF